MPPPGLGRALAVEDDLRSAQDIDLTAHHGSSLWLDVPPLARVRALLAEATPTALTNALDITVTCLRQAEACHNTRQVVQVSAFQSLVLAGQHRPTEAFAALDRALRLGGPAPFVRTFLDLGAPMATLLREFDGRCGPSPTVKRLLAAFTHEPGARRRPTLTAHYARLYGITPLTPREMELLTLIRDGLSMDDIARRLVISPNTVKKHVNNIYTKLGVRNSRQAIAQAQAIGFLTPDAS
ncbi:MAG: hypothetical protein KIT87_19965 [Anaerolineae bacterium]|nr:hypothetical protein [Anaerolineae bacterium]